MGPVLVNGLRQYGWIYIIGKLSILAILATMTFVTPIIMIRPSHESPKQTKAQGVKVFGHLENLTALWKKLIHDPRPMIVEVE